MAQTFFLCLRRAWQNNTDGELLHNAFIYANLIG